jgi:phosphinothricin acetyltransferase
MGSVRIRDAVDADVPAILDIYNEVLLSSAAIWRDELESLAERQGWLAAKREEGWPVLVAEGEHDGAVVGFAGLGPFRSWPGYWPTAEHTIHVRADRRGAGVGRALLEALAGRAAAMGKEVLVAGVDGDNAASIAFHERLGFHEVARMPGIGRKFGEPVDLVLLQKELSGAAVVAPALATTLDLVPHPEGGWFRETHRSAAGPDGRSAGTAIYFLVTDTSPSRLHRVDADEVFHHYLGDTVTQVVAPPGQETEVRRLGGRLDLDERPQAVVPAGSWQGCLVERPGGWALLGTTVSPGFEFAGFELAGPDVVAALAAASPAHAALLGRLAPDPA